VLVGLNKKPLISQGIGAFWKIHWLFGLLNGTELDNPCEITFIIIRRNVLSSNPKSQPIKQPKRAVLRANPATRAYARSAGIRFLLIGEAEENLLEI
jgi:radical SAM superfamily enzyme YgiQ (UPF0313 family)